MTSYDVLLGTQLGPLTIFDRTKGYGDCVDRFVGHPSSVETMVSLSSSQITQDVIATGSSDGLIRVVQIHPSKFLGVIAAHGMSSAEQGHEGRSDDNLQSNTEGLPIERMKLDRHLKWLGSISHDELLKLTDIEGALEGSEEDSDEQVDAVDVVNDQQNEQETKTRGHAHGKSDEDENADEVQADEDDIPHLAVNVPEEANGQESDSEASLPAAPSDRKQSKKRKKKELKREERKKRNKGGRTNSFFADL
jgi:WD repeat-containing protein 55